jgi:hypothetical protein
MSFQWLQLRIGEEKDRRARESQVLGRLPGALEELVESLTACVAAYAEAFGAGTARLTQNGQGLTISAEGKKVEVVVDPKLPGFQVQRESSTLAVQVGVLPGDRLFFLDVAADQYISMEELTRKILDRIFFPKLQE